MLYLLVAAIATAAAAYFFVNYLFARSSFKRATFIQRANATIQESKKLEKTLTLAQRRRRWALRHGWSGSFAPIVAAAGFLYLLTVVGFVAFGISSVTAAALAIPACAIVAAMLIRTFEDKRRFRFRQQLLQAMNLLAAQLESGVGAERGLNAIVNQIDNPLGEELEQALTETRAGKDLIEALRDLGERYPSRALTMLVSALEIDRKIGGQLGPVLRQAAATLEREFELTNEAQAEISQTRSEFFIVAAIILGICVVMITGSGATGGAVFTAPIGIIAMTLVGGNFVIGVIRVLGVLRRAKGRS